MNPAPPVETAVCVAVEGSAAGLATVKAVGSGVAVDVRVRGSVRLLRRTLGRGEISVDNALRSAGTVDDDFAAEGRGRGDGAGDDVGEGDLVGVGTGAGDGDGKGKGEGIDGTAPLAGCGGFGTEIGGGLGTGVGFGRGVFTALGAGSGSGLAITMRGFTRTAALPMVTGGRGGRRPTTTISPSSYGPNGPRLRSAPPRPARRMAVSRCMRSTCER